MEKKLLGTSIKSSTQINSFKCFSNMASDDLFLVTTVPLTSYKATIFCLQSFSIVDPNKTEY